jgi:hypothetical protein
MAGTVTLTHYKQGNIRRIQFSVVADAADGSVPDTTLPHFQGFLVALHTNPGATAPTDNYDITVIDGDGMDRLQGVGNDRDTTNSEQVPVVYTSTSAHPPVSIDETLTLKFANNSVHSAIIVGNLYYVLGL